MLLLFKRQRERFLPPLLFSSRFRWFPLSLLGFFFLLFFSVCSFSSLSLVRSLSSLSFVPSILSLSSLRVLPFLFILLSIYRGKKAGLFASAPGEQVSWRLVGHHPRQQGVAPLLSAGRAAGRPVASVSVVPRRGVSGHSVGSRRERERKI